ncbi:hypothetical protein D9M72_424310 [compost metagenome]
MDQRVHRVAGLAQVARLDPDLQELVLAGGGPDPFLDAFQLACHQREQVRRLAERVFPHGFMAAVGQVLLADQVAVGQQHRVGVAIGAQRDAEGRHHVRAVEEVGDAAEALGLALGEEVAVGHVQARQRGIGHGLARGGDLERALRGQPGDGQRAGVLGGVGHGLPVQADADQFEFVAAQHQRRVVGGAGLARETQRAGDDGALGIEIEHQVGMVDGEGGRGIVLAIDGNGRVGAQHGGILSSEDRWGGGHARAGEAWRRSPHCSQGGGGAWSAGAPGATGIPPVPRGLSDTQDDFESVESEVALCGSAQAVSAAKQKEAKDPWDSGARWRCWRRCCCQAAPAPW